MEGEREREAERDAKKLWTEPMAEEREREANWGMAARSWPSDDESERETERDAKRL